jgi:hypothetical protein
MVNFLTEIGLISHLSPVEITGLTGVQYTLELGLNPECCVRTQEKNTKFVQIGSVWTRTEKWETYIHCKGKS